ncbi:polysaccharide deacetylase family protein [Castellaniella sp.]|uniref:polysaccharide deacetylase family protein n=1 Tax=Castellaniella sp. TaxID=1955812 RepID=UPI00355EA927
MKSAHNVAVLMYHHVTEQPGSLAVTARQFENQMRGLVENGWRTLKADEFFAFMAGEPVAPRSLLLTFDDGYLDNWVHAHPVLERYGLNAVLFAVTGLVGEGPIRPHAGQHHVVLPACPSHHQAKVLMFSPERDQVMLRWDELQAMQAAGTFEIHSHTHTHTRWDQISASPSEKVASLRTDLLASRAMLTQRLGAASRHLCWPQGYFDADYLAVAQDSGFDCLYTTDARGQNQPGGNPGYVFRFAVRNRAWGWLRQRLWLATHPVWGPAYNKWKARSDARH